MILQKLRNLYCAHSVTFHFVYTRQFGLDFSNQWEYCPRIHKRSDLAMHVEKKSKAILKFVDVLLLLSLPATHLGRLVTEGFRKVEKAIIAVPLH